MLVFPVKIHCLSENILNDPHNIKQAVVFLLRPFLWPVDHEFLLWDNVHAASTMPEGCWGKVVGLVLQSRVHVHEQIFFRHMTLLQKDSVLAHTNWM